MSAASLCLAGAPQNCGSRDEPSCLLLIYPNLFYQPFLEMFSGPFGHCDEAMN